MNNNNRNYQEIFDHYQAATIVLAGGQGTRLFPLTQTRCKPNVSFGGRYKLIDIPISNSINAKINQIFVVSQYYATALNNHINTTFHANSLAKEKIEMLSPEETHLRKAWYKGTADAVRKNLEHFLELDAKYFIILSGDQLYNMDLVEMLEFTIQKDAELTIATTPVNEKDATRMGIMQVNKDHYIKHFYEKPKDPELLRKFKTDITNKKDKPYLGSMGIYIFRRDILEKRLKEDPREDFGKHIIPTQIEKGKKTAAYIYDGYWEDIGTIQSFYEANLALTTNSLGLDLYNEEAPIFAENIFLPSACLKNTNVKNSIICDGSVIEASEIDHSLIGIRSVIKEGTVIRDSIILGNPSYKPHKTVKNHLHDYYIGKNCRIEKAIIDEQTQISDEVHLINSQKLKTYDSDLLYVRDGIIVIPSGARLSKGFRF